MYQFMNNHTAPNLRAFLHLNNEYNNICDLRNRETYLSIPKPNTGCGVFVATSVLCNVSFLIE